MGRTKLGLAAAALAIVLTAESARAQVGSCVAPSMFGGACPAVAQALHSAVPQVGIAAAGGNPLQGTASVAGVRLGFFPSLTAELRLTGARMRLPDVGSANPAGSESAELVGSVDADLAVSLSRGLAGGVAGLGAVDLLASVGVLPGGGSREGASFTWGVGARLGILRESFGTPAVNVSAMYRQVNGVQVGSTRAGTPGELDFGVADVSVRATVARRVARFGLVGGAGYDRFTGRDARFSLTDGSVFQTVEQDVDEGRWSLFGNVSLPLTVGAVTLEGGWMSGGDAIPGYPSAAATFDPGSGTVFGSLSLRLSL
ncbi:MAG TPA: hypothetical protein VLK66_05820 [Longimicrobium sp.]|nr:hypothetical protein [Longimicrobium sp.]